MQIRATLASLLTAILLFVSPAAFGCEIRCALANAAGTMPRCHALSHDGMAQQGAMPPMAGMKDHGTAELVGAVHRAVASEMQGCGQYACAQPIALVREQAFGAVQGAVVSPQSSPEPWHDASDPGVGSSWNRGPPPFRVASPVARHTTLLI